VSATLRHDIRYVLNPSFTQQQVGELDTKRHWSRGLDGTDYLTGAIGLNNLKVWLRVLVQPTTISLTLN
jgi:hypothetical protein